MSHDITSIEREIFVNYFRFSLTYHTVKLRLEWCRLFLFLITQYAAPWRRHHSLFRPRKVKTNEKFIVIFISRALSLISKSLENRAEAHDTKNGRQVQIE